MLLRDKPISLVGVVFLVTHLLATIVGCVARNVLASSVVKVLEDTSMKKEGESPGKSIL